MLYPSVTRRTRGNDVGKGVLWMLVAMFLFIGMDASAKYLTADYPVPQIIWARFFFHLVVMAAIVWRRLPVIAVTLSPRFQLLRGFAVLTTNAAITTSLLYIPLAEVEALGAASPLFVALLSVPFLKEPVGLRRMIGVAIGFVGVVIIIRPGMGIVHPASFLALVAAFLYAINQVTMRYLGGFDAPMTTVFFTAVIGTVVTSLIVPFVWIVPEPEGWAIMVLMGCLSLSGQYAVVRAFAAAPAAAVSPFNYSALVWAALFGWILFADIPDLATIIGSVVIVAGGIAVIRSK